MTENYDVIIMIEYRKEPDLNFNLLFDGLPIIQRYLRHLSHKDKDHLEVGCKPNRPKSAFWSEFPGTRRYTHFFIMYFQFIGTNLQKTRSVRTRAELHVNYRGPISDNGIQTP